MPSKEQTLVMDASVWLANIMARQQLQSRLRLSLPLATGLTTKVIDVPANQTVQLGDTNILIVQFDTEQFHNLMVGWIQGSTLVEVGLRQFLILDSPLHSVTLRNTIPSGGATLRVKVLLDPQA